MGAHNEIDVGSLVWVKGEIDQAIERARQCMGQFQQNPGDASQLKFARTHLHQVTGAVQMVGLDGVARFCEEIEALVSAFEKTEVEASADHIAAIEQALTDLGVYLEDLINGAPDHTLKLYPAYERLKTARGAQKFSASELFFPSLDVFSLPANPAPSVADTELPGFVKAQRTRYELGLLKWLRGSTDDGL
ncbi:MAG: Hpt domain-containing protein, partial [Burkholderiales bacterium]